MDILSRLFGGGSAVLSATDYKSRYVDGKEEHVLVDVRTPEEFASGHIPGALNIPLQELGQKTDRLAKDKALILYCRSGSRSAHAAGMLGRLGYTNVQDLGGIYHWTSAGYPIKTGRK